MSLERCSMLDLATREELAKVCAETKIGYSLKTKDYMTVGCQVPAPPRWVLCPLCHLVVPCNLAPPSPIIQTQDPSFSRTLTSLTSLHGKIFTLPEQLPQW